MTSTKLIILDRDGVINHDSDEFIKSPAEWIPIPGSLDAIAQLNHSGYRVAVATNQSGIARGYFDIDTLNAIHQKMHQQLARLGGHIDAIFFCPHGPDDDCECRKPKPGLLRSIGDRFSMKLHDVPAIGDSKRDLQAALAVGARPFLVLTGKGEKTATDLGDLDVDIPRFADLAAAVDHLLADQ